MMILRTTFFPIALITFFSLAAVGQKKNTINKIDIKSNLVFIEGGLFNMGQDVEKDIVRRVTVSSSYIAATEVTNKEYREFLEWMKTYKTTVSLKEILPDETIWNRYIGGELGEQLTKDYFHLPAFDYHPVVGVNWASTQLYLEWKSDRINEQIAINNGQWTAEMQEKEPFSTIEFLKKVHTTKTFDLLMPNHRLPSEAEWEHAAWALIGKRTYSDEGMVTNQTFNYTATTPKTSKHQNSFIEKYRKKVLKHAKKYATPSYYDHNAYYLPKHVFDGDVNSYGLYNMNDNVSEWVQDAYRPVSKNIIRKISKPDLNPYEEGGKKGIKGSFEKKEKTRFLNSNITERVYKGANVRDEKGKIGPGHRYAGQVKGAQTILIGFRYAMTCTRRVF